ncbi:P-loop containing nucleoside triphosphate hydrolase protein, partial [Lyophyllum atratum]
IGPTSAGKSTFINVLLGADRMTVGDGSRSCTSDVQFSVIESLGSPLSNLEGYRVIVVDTPGFDDTDEGDAEILRWIAVWLKNSCEKNAILGGVIYLHDITHDRFSGTANRNLEMFNHLYGDAALSKVVLGTTKWSKISPTGGEAREEELKTLHWKPVLDKGSKIRRFQDTKESAMEFISIVLRHQTYLELIIATSVLGDAGVGKSTFINAVAGQPVAEVHDRLTSSEPVVKHFMIEHPQRWTRSFILVEAPGFDHYSESDDEILKQIIDWLKASCHKDASFGGIVYLHDITKHRNNQLMVTGTFTLLGLSRPEPTGHVLLATVKWNRAQRDPQAERREQELKDKSWRLILKAGAQTCRFINTKDSAWGIIDTLLQAEPLKLRILQQDLDRIHRALPKKSAPIRIKKGFFTSVLSSVGL